MENHSKDRVSRLFPSSFGSCRFKSVSDIVENSIFTGQNCQNAHDPLSSTPKTPQMVRKEVMKERPQQSNMKNSSSSYGGWFSSEEEETQVDGKTETFRSLSSDTSRSFRLNLTSSCRKTAKPHRRRGSTGSSEMGHFPFDVSAFGSSSRETAKGEQKTREVCRRMGIGRHCGYLMERKVQKRSEVSESSSDSYNDPGSVLHETTKSGPKMAKTKRRTEMSSSQFVTESFKSPPANSTDLYYSKWGSSSRKTIRNRRGRGVGQKSEMGLCPIVVDGRIEESYAMVKTSSDPCSDFRVSMVEMIVEKQIFGGEDLERLLKCFLSLNSSYHHKLIVQVFSEICEDLFTN